MRVFGYITGKPGYIITEFGVRDEEWTAEVSRVTSRKAIDVDGWRIPGEALTREEMLAVSTRRRALLAWEAKDDSALSRAQAQELVDNEALAVRMDAEEGCKVAGQIMARGLPADECLEHARRHLHVGCGHIYARPGLSLVD